MKFLKLKSIQLSLITIVIVTVFFTSCKEDYPKLPTKIDKETIETSFNYLSRLIEETDLNTALDQNYIDKINEKVNQISNENVNYSLSDAYQIRSIAVDLFKNNDLSSAMAHPWFPKDEALISEVVNFRETILNSLEEATTVEDIKNSIQQLKENILSGGLQEEENLLILQLDLSEKIILQIFDKYQNGNDSYNKKAGFKCNFWEWVCVGLSAAAAAVIIVSSGGSLAPGLVALYASVGGLTVAAVAACCICGCDCGFTDSCKEPSVTPPPVVTYDRNELEANQFDDGPCDCPKGTICIRGECVFP